MILIESADKKQRNINIRINAELMFADKCVEFVEVNISKFGIYITPTKLLIRELLPQPLKSNKMNLLNWFINRGLMRRSHRNIFFTELVLNLENRDLCMPLILSLSTNAISLSDKYWLNPIETTEFIVNGARISFNRKTWEHVDPFKNLYIPGQLEQYGLYDSFFIEKPDNMNPKSLVWSTDGCQNKRWMLGENGYYLEKKLYKKQLEDELSTLDFFLSNGVIVPQHDCYTKELNDPNEEYDRIYSIDTIQEGLHVIQKHCLTDSNSYLEKLIDYIDGDSEIEAPIRRMFSLHNVSKEQTEQFIKILKEYQEKFDVKDILLDTRNMGLLIDKNGAKPVVFGRLQRKLSWNGQLDD